MIEIHRPLNLAELPITEIDELLKMYNDTEIRQLARVAINTIKEQKAVLTMYKKKKNDAQDKFEDLRDDIFKVFAKYR